MDDKKKSSLRNTKEPQGTPRNPKEPQRSIKEPLKNSLYRSKQKKIWDDVQKRTPKPVTRDAPGYAGHPKMFKPKTKLGISKRSTIVEKFWINQVRLGDQQPLCCSRTWMIKAVSTRTSLQLNYAMHFTITISYLINLQTASSRKMMK